MLVQLAMIYTDMSWF